MLIFSLCNRDAFVLLWFDMVSDKGLLQGSWMLHDILFHSYTAKLSPGLTCTIVTADHKQLIGAFPAGCERQTRKWTRQCNVSELVPYPLSNPNYNFVYCVCFKLTCSFTSLHLHFLATFPNVGEETAFGSHSRVWTHCCAVSKYWAVWTDTPQEAVPALRLFVSWALSTLNVWQQSMQITSFFFYYRMACLNMHACLKTWMGILSVTIGFVWWQLLNTPSAPPTGYLKHPSDVYPPTA